MSGFNPDLPCPIPAPPPPLKSLPDVLEGDPRILPNFGSFEDTVLAENKEKDYQIVLVSDPLLLPRGSMPPGLTSIDTDSHYKAFSLVRGGETTAPVQGGSNKSKSTAGSDSNKTSDSAPNSRSASPAASDTSGTSDGRSSTNSSSKNHQPKTPPPFAAGIGRLDVVRRGFETKRTARYFVLDTSMQFWVVKFDHGRYKDSDWELNVKAPLFEGKVDSIVALLIRDGQAWIEGGCKPVDLAAFEKAMAGGITGELKIIPSYVLDLARHRTALRKQAADKQAKKDAKERQAKKDAEEVTKSTKEPKETKEPNKDNKEAKKPKPASAEDKVAKAAAVAAAAKKKSEGKK
ncbi:hypothetical protein B0H63DRAFT_465194 [Podospora didyma]|uniref:Uncharacterized protein n=1 Tax=Podospora didyma TaxID=330526 RepID=A0AAE0U472_9PEZI|nr:hypothetical protein B0H63DRAFT_465194 [Podospora didyma]